MNFKYLEKLSTDDSRYGRIGLAVALAVLVGLPVFIFIVGRLESTNPQLDHTLKLYDDAAVRRVESLCASLPKPEKLEFIEKSAPHDAADSTLVIYRYRSVRAEEEILPGLIVWFNENGWEHVPGTASTFRRGAQSVYIWMVANYTGDQELNFYEINCSEKK